MADRSNPKGAEAFAQRKRFDYHANSNLVLTAETRTREATEPSGEPDSLWGRIKGKMGDRAFKGRPEGLDERKVKAKKKREAAVADADGLQPIKKARRGPGQSVMDLESEGFYQPKTQATRDAYDALLANIQTQFGDQPHDVLRGAADEVLAVLKNDHLTDPQREKDISELLGELAPNTFDKLVALGKRMTDYTASEVALAVAAAADDGDALDDEIGVAVEFEGEDEDEDSEGDEVLDADEEDEDASDSDQEGAAGADAGGGLDAGRNASAAAPAGRAIAINVQDIRRDAFWLQRRIAEEFGSSMDAGAAQQLSEKVFKTLEASDNERELEQDLLALLDYDKFGLVKQLIAHRLAVVWCLRLARAPNEDTETRLEAEMAGREDTRSILEALKADRSSARERQAAMEAQIRNEARQLSGAGASGLTDGGVGAATGRKNVDLDGLAFSQGGHLNTNRNTSLPPGSTRTTDKGFEEIHVPALKPKKFGANEKLVTIEELPSWMHPAFEGMKSLNRIQSRVSPVALNSSENILMCAPTGAGKTNVAMLAILHTLSLYRRKDGSVDASKFKIIYVAPMKALVAEMVGNFGKRLKPFGLNVRELTGDMNLSKAEIEDTQMIIVTPEKWDIVTRKSGDRTYTQKVKLLIVDEIHLLHDDRGPVIESIIARTVRQIEASQEMIRLVGLSATLPNFEDVAAFLRVDPAKGLFHFDNSFRPCPLAQQYVGVTIKKPLQRFQLMNEICYNKALASAEQQQQVLIFVHSRKETAKTARYLKETALSNDTLMRFMKDSSASKELLQEEAESCKDAALKELLPFGFATHHAGMLRADRTLVEDLFADGHIQVLVSTATLAWGVNLPAHTVIIKGTQVYSPEKGAWVELGALDVMQMFGRAGRPQYDTQGEGIIITGHQELQFYLSLFNQQLPIESQYVRTIPDNLNAEIVLGTVQTLSDAAEWLKYTYLNVRMLRNPTLYGVPLGQIDTDRDLKERRMDLIHTAATQLDKHSMIKYDRRTGAFQATDLGRIASYYYITFNTLATFNEHLRPTMGDIELLRLFSLSDEFRFMVVREEEKMELAKLMERVPIPVKESIEEPTAKINVLLQAYISRLKLEGLALSTDMVYVTQSAGRLMRCLFEICLRRGWAGLTDKALALCKMTTYRLWGSQTPLRQFKNIPVAILQQVERKDLAWERWYDLSSQEIGEMIKAPKLGKTVHKLVHQFPRLELAAHVQPITRTVLKVDLTITPDFQWDDKVHNVVEPFWVMVEDSDSEFLLHHELFLLKKSFCEDDHTVSFTVPISEPLPPQYFIRVVSDRWLQSEAVLPVSFRHLILPERYPPPTELLDLQPLPLDALREASFEALFAAQGLTHFNPIQTQVFNTLYNTGDNALVAAPTGSGKTVCAEFAILRMLRQAREGKGAARCVYIAPMQALATERMADWSAKFGTRLGLNVVELAGEPTSDHKLLEKGNIVISTPEKWDMLSRRWRQRRFVKETALFIVDELHLLGQRHGAALEVVTSRMRLIASQIDKPLRIIGLCTSLANAKDLGEWIGATSHSLFNFPPGVRPVPLEIHIQGFDIVNFDSRLQAMARPTYANLVAATNEEKCSIVFVPTRKHARLTAMDILAFAAADSQPSRFLQAAEADIKADLDRVTDEALKYGLGFGVAFLHDTMLPSDRAIAERLFSSGAIHVMVVAAGLCWGLTAEAQQVVIMGTQYYDAGAGGTRDYPVTHLLQMIGRAVRAKDQSGKCLLLCHGPKKEYYKKFLFEPFPVESHLDAFLHDHLAAEVVTKTITTKQDAVDYLTWSFYYRRLAQNPNYYNLQGTSHRHLSDHLSDLIETTLGDLETSRVIAIEDDMDLEPLNLGMIAAYYYITYTTIELFASSLTAKTKIKGLLEILSAASEFDELPVRPGEEEAVRKLLAHAPVSIDKSARYTDPHTKANALLQAHFGRVAIAGDMTTDQRSILSDASRLLQAMVDVISSSGWLSPALAAMEMAQMVTQACWERDSPLMQVPHLTKDTAAAAAKAGVESIFDLADMEDDARQELLQMSEVQLSDVARFCNRYPDIQMTHAVAAADAITEGEPVTVEVTLERAGLEGELSPVDASRFPGRREENWWLVVGEQSTNSLLAIKRVKLSATWRGRVEFTAPSAGHHTVTVYFMCDSYMGADQEYEVELDVKASADVASAMTED